jgi:hypothetical protein
MYLQVGRYPEIVPTQNLEDLIYQERLLEKVMSKQARSKEKIRQ